MTDAAAGPSSPSLATSAAGRGQRRAAAWLCLGSFAATLALLPYAAAPIPPMPGFGVANQTALLLVYGLTAHLFLAQYGRTRSVPLLVLGAGGLFTAGVVALQLACFPDVFAPGLLVGHGPNTLTWLWTFWHLGPPLFALAYALLEGDGRSRLVRPGRVASAGWLAAGAVAAALALVGLLVTRYIHLLPLQAEGASYRLLNASGVGPALTASTVLTLVVLCWTTRLRTVLQLWLAVSLALLVADNLVTGFGAARGTVGWFAGRILALLAGLTVLGVYLRELDALHARADATAAAQERLRAEAQSAQDNLAVALDASGMGDWEMDLPTGASRRTPRHDRIFGHAAPPPRWDRAAFLSHVLPEDAGAVEAAFDAASRGGRLEFECRIRRADDGAVRWVAVRGMAYFDAAGRPAKMAGVVMDTTERHETEDRLRQAERMDSVGQLTGGVAHDFNNLLTVIVGALDMLLRKPGDPARVERLAGNALAAARRGAELTGKLLAFSRRQAVRPETLNPNRLLQEFQPLLQRAATERVELALDLDPALDPTRLDPRQFEAAMLNLVANARDAMPSGGRIAVATRNASLASADAAEAVDVAPGAYLSVAVSDTGIGMDPATARRAFEPFFTTKEVGKGTGLGLSQVYGFAKQAGGGVRIRSKPGHGTTVELLLPRSAGEQAPGAGTAPEAVPLRRAARGEVVLVVEDEASVLEMAVESLTELGYKTLAAPDARAALERLRGPDRIDLLFSDVVMPGGMDGVQLAAEARRLRPGLNVVLASGYTASALEHGAELPRDVPLLSKPYLRDDLASTLRAAMGR